MMAMQNRYIYAAIESGEMKALRSTVPAAAQTKMQRQSKIEKLKKNVKKAKDKLKKCDRRMDRK